MMKVLFRFLIRLMQICIFLLVSIGAVYVIFISCRFGFEVIRSIDLGGDLIVKGIPVATAFITIIAIIMALFGIGLVYFFSSILIIVLNGSLGDTINYLNLSKYTIGQRRNLIFRPGGLRAVRRAGTSKNGELLEDWWEGF